MKLEFYRQIFQKYPDVICNENPSTGSQFVPCGQTDMMKLIVAFRSFANTPKNAKSDLAGSMVGSYWYLWMYFVNFLRDGGVNILARKYCVGHDIRW
jgi:hypothetical protein